MYGAILGDMIGAPYEFDRGKKTKEFPLFSNESEFTDDTVMTIAVADAQLGTPAGVDEAIRRLEWMRLLSARTSLIPCITGENCIRMPATAACSIDGCMTGFVSHMAALETDPR